MWPGVTDENLASEPHRLIDLPGRQARPGPVNEEVVRHVHVRGQLDEVDVGRLEDDQQRALAALLGRGEVAIEHRRLRAWFITLPK